MSMQSMSNILEQIQSPFRQAASLTKFSDVSRSESKPEFASVLRNSVDSINKMQITAKNQAEDYVSGASDMSLNNVMVSLQKSTLALNLGVQVRNKLVSAYQDIMSMAV
ncbi:flagellar hook-basal body protein FliE [Leclercia adecarboxylata]|nr:flagellar hook-basal body protein FliE [Leclercia adecarboxylata]KMN61757.1 flagellar hook-basal body protein FliE [Leclercia sp. LK8]